MSSVHSGPPVTPPGPPVRPLVVTLGLDPVTQRRFDRERAEPFPRTQVAAHVTLFHALPGDAEGRVLDDAAAAAARPTFAVLVAGLQPLGRGVAYRLEAPELLAVHARLRRAWEDLLTPQDRQPFRPHVTVQNKVAPDDARRTLARLAEGFVPVAGRATGLAVWRYDGGPWTLRHRLAFADPR